MNRQTISEEISLLALSVFPFYFSFWCGSLQAAKLSDCRRNASAASPNREVDSTIMMLDVKWHIDLLQNFNATHEQHLLGDRDFHALWTRAG
jgi:hypothetical protein